MMWNKKIADTDLKTLLASYTIAITLTFFLIMINNFLDLNLGILSLIIAPIIILILGVISYSSTNYVISFKNILAPLILILAIFVIIIVALLLFYIYFISTPTQTTTSSINYDAFAALFWIIIIIVFYFGIVSWLLFHALGTKIGKELNKVE